jgi:hypothetical protein
MIMGFFEGEFLPMRQFYRLGVGVSKGIGVGGEGLGARQVFFRGQILIFARFSWEGLGSWVFGVSFQMPDVRYQPSGGKTIQARHFTAGGYLKADG